MLLQKDSFKIIIIIIITPSSLVDGHKCLGKYTATMFIVNVFMNMVAVDSQHVAFAVM